MRIDHSPIVGRVKDCRPPEPTGSGLRAHVIIAVVCFVGGACDKTPEKVKTIVNSLGCKGWIADTPVGWDFEVSQDGVLRLKGQEGRLAIRPEGHDGMVCQPAVSSDEEAATVCRSLRRAPLKITGLSPSTGDRGDTITIEGSGFLRAGEGGGVKVLFGKQDAKIHGWKGDCMLTVEVPPASLAARTVDVTVRFWDSPEIRLDAAFTYDRPVRRPEAGSASLPCDKYPRSDLASENEDGCEAGCAERCADAAAILEQSSGQAEHDLAVARYAQACRAGVAGSCDKVLALMKAGWGVPARRPWETGKSALARYKLDMALVDLVQHECSGGDRKLCVAARAALKRAEKLNKAR